MALNSALNHVANMLAERFDGVAEEATLSGLVDEVAHVSQYFPLCVSHRAVAEAADLGWRGRHGLIVTPEYGPALRLATVFIVGRVDSPQRQLAGCGTCQACLDVCPVLRVGTRKADPNFYREMCRRRIVSLGLDAEVCGICVRRCWEVICQDSQHAS
jgi:epoxyqueuosine reductase QueG